MARDGLSTAPFASVLFQFLQWFLVPFSFDGISVFFLLFFFCFFFTYTKQRRFWHLLFSSSPVFRFRFLPIEISFHFQLHPSSLLFFPNFPKYFYFSSI